MNVSSQATISYAYALGSLKIKNITTSNVVNTEVRTVNLLAKKTANTEFFKPNDIITYNIVITNPGNSNANDVVINDDLFHQKFVEGSFKYLFLDDSKSKIALKVNENNLIFTIDTIKPGEVCVISYQVIIDDLEEVCVDLRNSSNIYSKEVQPFITNNLNLIQKYAKIECSKKTVDYTYFNTDLSYLINLKNTGNTAAIDIEVIDQLPKTFELSAKNPIMIGKQSIDIFVFDKETNILKFIIDKIDPNASIEVVIKGKIVK